MSPTSTLVRKAMREYRKDGMDAFCRKYTNGHRPHYMYLRHDGVVYPLKALWAASHQPPAAAKTFNSVQARSGFKNLGFTGAVKIEDGEEHAAPVNHSKGNKLKSTQSNDTTLFSEDIVVEGERLRKEISFIKRNASIVTKAKRERGCTCEVCGFNFGEAYGELGADFIEAHHTEPLSTRRNRKKVTTTSDFAMLCANCHRMIHRKSRVLTIKDLQKIVQRQRQR